MIVYCSFLFFFGDGEWRSLFILSICSIFCNNIFSLFLYAKGKMRYNKNSFY